MMERLTGKAEDLEAYNVMFEPFLSYVLLQFSVQNQRSPGLEHDLWFDERLAKGRQEAAAAAAIQLVHHVPPTVYEELANMCKLAGLAQSIFVYRKLSQAVVPSLSMTNVARTFGQARTWGMAKFLTHESIANQFFMPGVSVAAASHSAWQDVLVLSEDSLQLMTKRMSHNYSTLNVKMRKPWSSKELAAKSSTESIVFFGSPPGLGGKHWVISFGCIFQTHEKWSLQL